jgi:hypothetical protein
VSPKPVVVIVDGGILSAILRVLTRYSANDPQFPVNNWPPFTGVPATGKCHAIGGASRPNGRPTENPRWGRVNVARTPRPRRRILGRRRNYCTVIVSIPD